MKITERQLIILLNTTAESLKFTDRVGIFTFPADIRRAIAEEVINQQTATLETAEPPQEPPK